MRAYDIIAKKRDGKKLTTAELEYMIQGYTGDQIPDYQMAAFTMAAFLQGLDAQETADLTMAMVQSGDQVDLSSIAGIKVDKHSTGGVGDTTTLVLAPLVAAAGAPVAKMSGRGLGHTGGTLDKFEAIPGFNVELPLDQFVNNVNEVKVAVVGQSGNLVPADKKLYALRDVTATVNSIPLIASSIMSKKLAAGADAIVLDVKTGSGAFMKTIDESFALAQAMVDIGNQVGRQTVAIITTMEQPLGQAIGNGLEVKEAIATLRGEGPADLQELCLALGVQMLLLAKVATTEEEARTKLLTAIKDGSALQKFKQLIEAQGGDSQVVDHPELLPRALYQEPVLATRDGYIAGMESEALGIYATLLGAGRQVKTDVVDPAAGIILYKKVGDQVEIGETLAVVHTNNQVIVAEIKQKILAAFEFTTEKVSVLRLVYGKVTADGQIKY